MRLFDCTLRDGANVVGNGFDKELTEEIIRNLLACGVKDIEFGNAKGIGAYERQEAMAPETDEEYLKLAHPYTEKGRLGMFLQAQLAEEKYIKLAAEFHLDFLRVGIAAGNSQKAIKAVEMVKKAGLRCRYSQMKAYLCTPKELAEEAALLEKAGVDAITIMDSAGTMLPDETAEYVTRMKEKVSIPVGFHGHNNLGLSQANALAAVMAGADEIDCGLLGMARSSGNCATELMLALLCRMQMAEENALLSLVKYLKQDLIPAMEKCGYHTAVKPDDLILGLAGCHSAFLKTFYKIAEEKKVDTYQLILRTSEKEKNNPGEELIRRIADKIGQV